MEKLLLALISILLPITLMAQGAGGEIRRPVRTNVNTQPSRPTNNISTNMVNGHEFVDLGLSVKWATCNIGASSPQDGGFYYAWGETRPKTDYSWKTYFDIVDGSSNPHLSDEDYTYIKDDFVNYTRLTKTKLDRDCDAASVIWGGSWEIPSHEEFNELWTLDHEWTSIAGIYGVRFKAKNGNSIFLPAVGGMQHDSSLDVQRAAIYWINELHDDDYDVSELAKMWLMDKEGGGWSVTLRCYGFPIRPVTK